MPNNSYIPLTMYIPAYLRNTVFRAESAEFVIGIRQVNHLRLLHNEVLFFK